MNNYTYKATGLELTVPLREYMERRLAPFFKKYEIVGGHMNVELGKSSQHHKNGEIFYAEAYFKAKNRNIFARAEKGDIYEAMDHLQSELGIQLEGAKGKRFALFKRGATKIKKMLKFDFS